MTNLSLLCLLRITVYLYPHILDAPSSLALTNAVPFSASPQHLRGIKVGSDTPPEMGRSGLHQFAHDKDLEGAQVELIFGPV
jgi:hypothetical protein